MNATEKCEEISELAAIRDLNQRRKNYLAIEGHWLGYSLLKNFIFHKYLYVFHITESQDLTPLNKVRMPNMISFLRFCVPSKSITILNLLPVDWV